MRNTQTDGGRERVREKELWIRRKRGTGRKRERGVFARASKQTREPNVSINR